MWFLEGCSWRCCCWVVLEKLVPCEFKGFLSFAIGICWSTTASVTVATCLSRCQVHRGPQQPLVIGAPLAILLQLSPKSCASWTATVFDLSQHRRGAHEAPCRRGRHVVRGGAFLRTRELRLLEEESCLMRAQRSTVGCCWRADGLK